MDRVSELTELLESLAQVVGRRAPELTRTLRPGVDEDQIGRANAELAPWVLPDDVAALYRWHDGGDGPEFGGAGLFLNWQMRPLEVALDRWRFVRGTQPECWLEVFADLGRPIVDLSAGDAPVPRDGAPGEFDSDGDGDSDSESDGEVERDGEVEGEGAEESRVETRQLIWYVESEGTTARPVASSIFELASLCISAVTARTANYNGWRFDTTPAELTEAEMIDFSVAIESASPRWPESWRRSLGITVADETRPEITSSVSSLSKRATTARQRLPSPLVIGGVCVWDRAWSEEGWGHLEDATGHVRLRIPHDAFVYADPLGRDGIVELAGPDPQEAGAWIVRRLFVS